MTGRRRGAGGAKRSRPPRAGPRRPRSPKRGGPGRTSRAPTAPRGPGALARAGDDALLAPQVAPVEQVAAEALARLRSLETIQDGYEAWAELRALHAKAQAGFRAERARLQEQGGFLLGAVQAARELSGEGPKTQERALAQPQALDALVASTRDRLARAGAALEEAVQGAERDWARVLAEAVATVRGRVERTLALHRPAVRLVLRGLGGGRKILHLERLQGDAPVLVHAVLTQGHVPSRHDFLFDDSTDDVALPLPTLYPEEGVAPAEVRPAPAALRALLERPPGVVPSKAHLPLRVPGRGPPLLARFLQRGPVAEAEVEDGEGWRNVLAPDEAERIAGWLLKLQLDGRLQVDVVPG